MQLAFTLLVSLLTFLDSAHSTDYCNPDLCRHGTNIACNNDGQFSSSCINPRMVELTASEKEALVNMHNEKRNTVAGGSTMLKPACRMATMEWDEELASMAAFNVKRCKIEHDDCRNTDTFRHSGQNIAWMNFYGAPNVTIMSKRAMDLWYNEIMDTDQAIIDKYPRNYDGNVIGHFTVIMADRNIRVGCASIIYREEGDDFDGFLLTCNYATTNVVNFRIYKSCSEPAVECETGTNPDFPNLCSTSETYDLNKFV
ncbi:antigen 5 like allergen Cul n 1-like isoform X3 [Bactrocera dorsalis]|uniref:Antigen 5 like allergen Cul n 1-like isoform X3 n=1 Tax=Bactrocera dorsalis TaxID=27457 RepID=A0ABM3JR52_BACDO|nr:antigen 5 like allergen Cul n 1-like isoform X3 [Bactrocera dorsalis]